MAITKVDLANTVTGVLPVANGGTGTSTGVAPGGSTTQVQYNNAGAFGGDSGFVYTGGNVGIGVTPAYKLDVVSGAAYIAHFGDGSTASVSIQKDALVFGNAAPSGYSVGNYDASYHVWKLTNTERMRLDSSGNLLVGSTTNPNSLKIAATGADNDNLIGSYNTLTGNAGIRIQANQAGLYLQGSGTVDAMFITNTSATGYIALRPSSNSEKVRITANGGLAFNGASNYGSSGQVLTSNGDAPPTWGAVTIPTSLGAIGTYFVGFSVTSGLRVIPGDTASGADLRYHNPGTGTGDANSLGGGTETNSNITRLPRFDQAVSPSLSGTWRAMSASKSNNGGQWAGLNLWVRVS